MLKAYKYRIYPTQAQQAKLVQDMGCVRFIYNAALAYCKESYDSGDKKLKSKFTLTGDDFLNRGYETKVYYETPDNCVNIYYYNLGW